LDINATDINSGLEYLPARHVFYFTFGNKGRRRAGVDELKNIMAGYLGFEDDEDLEN
jgi:hypothetical protein